MVKIRATTRYLPKRFRHRPTMVEGIEYDGEIDCARAVVDWGRQRTSNSPFEIEDGELLALTRQGRRYVPVNDTAVLGVKLEPYSVDPEVREISYVELGVDYSAVPLTIGRVRELADESRTASGDRLRDINAQLVALCEALLA